MEKSILIKIYRGIWYLFGGLFLMIIFVGLLKYMVQDIEHKNYQFFWNMVQISLTLFGITLIGAIFESKNKPEIIKNMLEVNLSFLMSFISFLFLNSYQIIDFNIILNPFFKWLFPFSMIFAVIVGFTCLILGIYLLTDTLFRYYTSR